MNLTLAGSKPVTFLTEDLTEHCVLGTSTKKGVEIHTKNNLSSHFNRFLNMMIKDKYDEGFSAFGTF